MESIGAIGAWLCPAASAWVIRMLLADLRWSWRLGTQCYVSGGFAKGIYIFFFVFTPHPTVDEELTGLDSYANFASDDRRALYGLDQCGLYDLSH